MYTETSYICVKYLIIIHLQNIWNIYVFFFGGGYTAKEMRETRFYGEMLRITCVEYVNNWEDLKITGAYKKAIVIIKKRHLKFLGNMMRKIVLENLILSWHFEDKRDRQRILYLIVTIVKLQEFLIDPRNWKFWRAINCPYPDWIGQIDEEDICN